MKNKLKKSVFVILGIVLMLTMMSCNSKPSNDNPSNPSNDNDSENTDYLLCNATSYGNMAEIESGFYFLISKQLYYADRNDMSNWVAVCNKPDCSHDNLDDTCNANIGNEITQKEDKLYFYEEDLYPNQGYIYQVSQDGSESEKVFKVPLDYSGVDGGRETLSQEGFFKYHKILGEDGNYIMGIYRLEDDGSMHTLFEKKYESDFSVSTHAAYHYLVRGEFTIISSLLSKEEGQETNLSNALYRVDGDKPERVNLPDDVSIEFSYLGEDSFTYYKKGEGFFEIDLETQTETCMMKNQLSDARGYRLTEDYLIECNRYNAYMPDEASMKFYDGSKWIDVELPELVAKTDCYFTPTSVATDRIFFTLTKNGIPQLYYFMIEEENPTLTLATTFGDESVFEMIEPDVIHKVDITIFDTPEYTAKLVEVGFGLTRSGKTDETAFGMKVSFENKTDKTLELRTNNVSINGVSLTMGSSTIANPYETVENTYSISVSDRKLVDYKKKLTSFLFNAWVEDEETNEWLGPQTIVEVYPYGEENVTLQEREPLVTDDILIDNQWIRLTAIEYWESTNKKATVKFFVENKTDSMISCGATGIISINGQLLNQFMSSEEILLPKSHGYLTVEIFDEWLKDETVKEMVGEEVKEYSINFMVMEYSLNPSVAGQPLGQLLYEEEVLLSPKR